MKPSISNPFFYFFTILTLTLCLSNHSFAQKDIGEIGVIYSKAEADQLYGPVLISKSIDTKILSNVLQKITSYVMFGFKNNNFVITNEYRQVILSNGISITDNDVLSFYSKSKVQELLNLGKDNTTFIEQRSEKLTITNGAYTLEFSVMCPPTCL
ncbi:MAG: hypothetical protein KJ666_02885 [Bacteroidetes bacterium]|nr:hypothetical protein [Bacteroidota bacterium]